MTAMSVKLASTDNAAPVVIIEQVPVAEIRIPADHRKHHSNAIAALAENIEIHGLRQPIEIVYEDNGYRLIFGALRLQAHQLLGRTTVDAIVKEPGAFTSEATMRLVSISENMLRNPLSALDRGVAIADWCSIYRAAQLPMKPGLKSADARDPEGSLKFRLTSADLDLVVASEEFAASFSEAAQVFLKISRAAVFRAIRIASIPSLQRDRIALHGIADNEGQLYELGGIRQPERQVGVINLILSEKARTVAEAIALIDNVPQSVKARWERISDTFARLKHLEQDHFFDLQDAAISRWQAKRGRK
jgi:ParB family chromosome partitioning protein